MTKIKLENAETGYRLKKGVKTLVQNINISANQGELIALIGVNGSGKSTLLRSVIGLQNLLSGEITIDGKNYLKYRKTESAKKIAFVSSEIIRTKYLKVIDIVSLGRFPHQKLSNKNSKKDEEIVESALETVRMSDFKEKLIAEISDGERQKVMTARALAQDTDIILLDEPAAFLDLENKFGLYKILHDTAHDLNKTIIFSTHDLNIAMKYCDKVWLIKDKKIIEGSPEDLILAGKFQNIFSDEQIYFNNETFEFSVKPNQKYPIKIINHPKSEKLNHIILNALKRKGFYPSDKNEEISVEIYDKTKFILNYKERIFESKNIYNLLKKLSEINI